MLNSGFIIAMRPGAFENFIWYLNIAAGIGLIARMYFERLTGAYPALLAYLATNTCGDMATLSVTLAGRYKWAAFSYYGAQGAKVVVAAFVAMELFRLALAEHPALARFGQKAIGYFFGAGFLLGALNVWFGARYQGSRSTGVFIAFERSMDLMVMVALLLMAGFLLWYPVRMRRNAALCIAGFVLYSFQRWAGLLMEALWPPMLRGISTGMLCLSLVLLIFWSLALRREGERVNAVTGLHWDPSSAAHLTSQLERINARLKSLEHDKAEITD